MGKIIERISHFFAVNKPLSFLLLMGALLFGTLAFLLIPKQYNPEIVRPAFFLSFDYEGATPAQAVDRVIYELIEKIQVIPGVDDIYSTVKDGTSVNSTIIFTVGEDKVAAKANLVTQIESHSHFQTGAIKNVSVREINPETISIMQVVVSSGSESVLQLRDLSQKIRQRLLGVSGVSEITVVGGEQSAVVIELDPLAVHGAGLSIEQVLGVLNQAGLRQVEVGFENTSVQTRTVLVSAAITPESLANLPIINDVALRDVATVYEGVSPERSYALHLQDGGVIEEVIVLGIAKQEGQSAPIVAKALRQELKALFLEENYKNISYDIVADDGVVASQEIVGLSLNLLTSIVIVSFILFLFLSPRAALVVLMTIPLTFLIVIGIGFLAGETMNRITLFALILSLGLLVDSSIVVVDVIYDHLQRAVAEGRQASLPAIVAGAVKEVGGGLVISTITSVVVFLPMLYITGMMGPYMGPIAFFVPIALLVALVVAIILAPFIALVILRADERQWRLNDIAQSVIKKITNVYIHFLRRLTREKKLRSTLLWSAGGLLLLSFLLPLFALVHFQMLPKADRDQIYLYIDMPTATAREATKVFATEVMQQLDTYPAVASVQAFVATAPVVDFNGLFKGVLSRTNSEQATLRINLESANNRNLSSTKIANHLRTQLSAHFGEEAAFIRLLEEPPGPPVLATFEAKITTGNNATEVDLAQALNNRMANIPGVVDRFDSTEQESLQVVYEIDHQAMVNYGVSYDTVLAWYNLINSYQLGESIDISKSERVSLLAILPYQYRSVPDLLLSIPVVGNSKSVTLGNVLIRNYSARETTRYFDGANSISSVTAEVEGRSIVYVMIDTIKMLINEELGGYKVINWNLFNLTLQNESGEKSVISWGGEWKMTLENFRDLGLAMIVALVLVYGILVAQYRSFSVPGLVLVTVPLGLIGILFGFTLLDQGFGIYLTATALIGFIALIGIVVNNAIIYLEYVEQAVADGLAYPDALVAAGALRLRPILLTSLTTVLGSLTIASDPVWSGLAWSIVFGLSLSTFLTLIILPSFLLAVHKEP